MPSTCRITLAEADAMIRFEVELVAESVGWVTIRVQVEDRDFRIECSYHGGDAVGELVAAFVTLAGGAVLKSVEVNCFDEPGSVRLRLRRDGDVLEVAAWRFSWEADGATSKSTDRAMRTMKSKDWLKMMRSRNRKANLRETGPFVVAVRALVASLERIEAEVGSERYKQAWGFDCPTEDVAVLKRFLSQQLTIDT